MANVNVSVEQLVPMGGPSKNGYKVGLLPASTKAAQNDTVTIKNAKAVIDADLRIVATGAAEPNTLSTNVITLTSATTGSVRGQIVYR